MTQPKPNMSSIPALPTNDEIKTFLAQQEEAFQYIYVRQELYVEDDEIALSSFGGLTIVYDAAAQSADDSLVYVSLAWCHPDERFKKLLGRYFATKRYQSGQSIPIRLPNRGNHSQQLKELFLPFLG